MFVVPIEERALEAYEGGYRKARELGIYNQWTVLMREGLTRMNDVEYPPIREIGGDIVKERVLSEGVVIEGLMGAQGTKKAASSPPKAASSSPTQAPTSSPTTSTSTGAKRRATRLGAKR